MNQRRKNTQNIILLGAASNIILAAVKIYGGIAGHSQALAADGIHSLADLITDFVVLFAARFSAQEANIKYPYGYARVETLATAALAVLLLITGLGIMYDAGRSLFIAKELTHPSYYVLAIAVTALVIKEILFRYTLKVGKKLQSTLLQANAWHHRSDAASSLVVLVGIIGSLLGFVHLDALASIVVAIMIIKMGWELTSSSVRELIDVGLDTAVLQQIEQSTLATEGVRAIHQLRARSASGKIFLDMHLLVSPRLSVSEGHFIAAKTQRDLMNLMPSIADITIHVDPEDDDEYDTAYRALNLPPRDQVIESLKQHWEDLITPEELRRIRLDYLAARISITVILSAEKFENLTQAQTLLKELKTRIENIKYIHRVNLSYKV